MDALIVILPAIVIIATLIIYVIIALKDSNKEIKGIRQARSKIHYYYDSSSRTLSISSRDPLLSELLVVKKHKYGTYKEVPDEYIYTSVTVGGVTTGGITKVEGGISKKEHKSDRYALFLKELYTNQNHVETIRYCEVEKIALDEKLLEEAKDSSVRPFINGKNIDVVEGLALPKTFKYMDSTTQLSTFSACDNESHPSKNKIDTIFDWLTCVDQTDKTDDLDMTNIKASIVLSIFSAIGVFIGFMLLYLLFSNNIVAIVASVIIILITTCMLVQYLISYVYDKKAVGVIVVALILICSLALNVTIVCFTIEYGEEGSYIDHQCDGLYLCENTPTIKVKKTFSFGKYDYYCQYHYEKYLNPDS